MVLNTVVKEEVLAERRRHECDEDRARNRYVSVLCSETVNKSSISLNQNGLIPQQAVLLTYRTRINRLLRGVVKFE